MLAQHRPRKTQNFGRTVNLVVGASTVLCALQVAVARSLAANERGCNAPSVACTELRASLKALSVRVVNIASVKVNSAGQRQRARAHRVGAAIILRTGEALWANLLGTRCCSLYGLARSDSNADDILTA